MRPWNAEPTPAPGADTSGQSPAAPGATLDAGPRVADLTEEQLLARFVPLLPAGTATLLGPGDDCAVIGAPDGRFVVSTDVLVEGRHFRRCWSSGFDVGARAAAQNLADVAAMGARPTALVVSLVLPGSTPAAWVDDLARGLASACAPRGVGVVGGDLSGGEEIVVAVTAHGNLEGRPPVTRRGARPGDIVWLAGELGHSAAGLALLDAGADTEGLDVLVTAHLRPDPPIEAGPAAALAGASAMLDVSDGLVLDAGRLARASGVAIDLDAGVGRADLPILRTAADRLGGRDPDLAATNWILSGGEDHGLLAVAPPGVDLPEPFVRVGRVLARGSAGPAVLVGGAAPHTRGGWDHFAGDRGR